jgi:chaperone required for assembly of F1-ATPase
MRESLISDWFGFGERARPDPVLSTRAGMGIKVLKRFYKSVSITEGPEGFALLLDGKKARTKAGNGFTLPNAQAAALVEAEWAAQAETIDAASMPVTRLVHAAIDHVGAKMAEVAADLLGYAGSDLVCYRADHPAELVQRQNAGWNPVLDHARGVYGADFRITTGISPIAQPEAALAAIGARIGQEDHPCALSTLHSLTSLSGSVLIAIMVADGALSPQAGYEAGELDARFETSVWGEDAEAEARFFSRKRDFLGAASLYRAVKLGSDQLRI